MKVTSHKLELSQFSQTQGVQGIQTTKNPEARKVVPNS